MLAGKYIVGFSTQDDDAFVIVKEMNDKEAAITEAQRMQDIADDRTLQNGGRLCLCQFMVGAYVAKDRKIYHVTKAARREVPA